MSIAQLQALYATYSADRAAGDYDGAIGAVDDMIALLAITPDLEGSAGGGEISQTIKFRSHDLQLLVAELRRLKAESLAAASGPFQRTKVTYVRVTS